MKSAVADYQTIIYCLKIVPVSGDTVYLTNYPRNLTINSHVYRSDSGYDFTGVESDTKFSPGMFDLSGIVDVAGVDRDAVASGVFDNARVYAFATTWTDPVEDEEEIGCAIFGKTQIIDDRYVAQMMMLIDVLNQSVGDTYEAVCQKQFGSQTYAGCMVDAEALTVTGTITSITSAYVFRDSARSEAVDYFAAGTIEITSGDNAGLKVQEVKAYAANGTITLFEPFFYALEVGDTYTMVPGCRKRLKEDCRDKYNNVVNFGGYPTVPVGSVYAQRGDK